MAASIPVKWEVDFPFESIRSGISTVSNDDEIQRLQLRLPNDLYEVIKNLAERNFRSANSEILYLISLGLEKVKECASPDEVRQIIREELAKTVK